jgi:hypothetical protein
VDRAVAQAVEPYVREVRQLRPECQARGEDHTRRLQVGEALQAATAQDMAMMRHTIARLEDGQRVVTLVNAGPPADGAAGAGGPQDSLAGAAPMQLVYAPMSPQPSFALIRRTEQLPQQPQPAAAARDARPAEGREGAGPGTAPP